MLKRLASRADKTADLLIASSDPALRRRVTRSLRREPDLGGIREAKDRARLERALTKLSPLVLLLDVPLKGPGQLESLQRIRALSPTTRTILLVDSPDDSMAVRALKEGARGYCSRKTDPELLLRAIRLVRDGEIWVGRKVIHQLIEELTAVHGTRVRKAGTRFRLLTQRERQICSVIAAGASNKEIAERLSITGRTVKAHLTNIFQKLGLSTRLQLAIYALEVPRPASDQSPIDRGERS